MNDSSSTVRSLWFFLVVAYSSHFTLPLHFLGIRTEAVWIIYGLDSIRMFADCFDFFWAAYDLAISVPMPRRYFSLLPPPPKRLASHIDLLKKIRQGQVPDLIYLKRHRTTSITLCNIASVTV